MKRGRGSPACIISIPHLLLIIFWFSRFDCCFCCLQLQLQSMQIQNRQKRRRKVLTKFRPKNALTNIHTYIQTCIHMYVCILYIDRNTNTDAQFSWLPFMHFHSPAAVALALSVSFAFSLPPTHLVSQPLGTFRTPLPPPLSTFLLPYISLYSCVCVSVCACGLPFLCCKFSSYLSFSTKSALKNASYILSRSPFPRSFGTFRWQLATLVAGPPGPPM